MNESVIAYDIIREDEYDALLSDPDRGHFLFLEEHPSRPYTWLVDSFDPSFKAKFKDILKRRIITPFNYQKFEERAHALGYTIKWLDDPTYIWKWADSLYDIPEVRVESSMPNTVNGLWPYQVQGYNFLKTLHGGVANWSTGPQPLDSVVITPNGGRQLGHLKVGDLIIGIDGRPQRVTGVFPQGLKRAFRLIFSDGSTAISSDDHFWTLEKWTNGSRSFEHRQQRRGWTKPLREFMDDLYVKNGNKSSQSGYAKWALPLHRPVEFCSRSNLPLDPYLLGILLGDGSIGYQVCFTTGDFEIIELVESLLPDNCHLTKINDISFRIVGSKRGKNEVLNVLRELDLHGCRSWEKFIPREYMRSSIQDRLALLQGLLDSDGCASGCGASFTSTSLQLAIDVVELARSLGFVTTQPKDRITQYTYKGVKQNGRVSYRTQITSNGENLFRLQRKQSKLKSGNQVHRRLIDIEEIDPCEMVCISVSNNDGLYLTNDYVPTHNTGKTILACALAKYYLNVSPMDRILFVVKAHNKINVQRELQEHVGLEAIVVEGVPKKRRALYDTIQASQEPLTVILNYEKFRDDELTLTRLVEGQKVFVIWDEMPTKLKSRTSQLYRAVSRVLYTSATEKRATIRADATRPSELRQIMLSATPIEVSPMDYYNCIRLIDPEALGTISNFTRLFVKKMSRFAPGEVSVWKNLSLMGEMTSSIVHQVDKSDPDIAKYFPADYWDLAPVEMSPKQRKLMDILMLEDEDDNAAAVLAQIGVAQMILNDPLMILRSAKRRLETDRFGSALALKLVENVGEHFFARDMRAPKFDMLCDKLDMGEKCLVFTTYNEMMLPYLGRQLNEAGYPNVLYHGKLNAKQKQAAEDQFKNDPDIKVFLSSDSGSDSLNLQAANLVVDYDLPWNWSRLTQRHNRVSRATSKFKSVWYWSLYIPDSIEDRKMEILDKKQEYHKAVLKGAVAEMSEGARLNDLRYILRGNEQ